MRAEEILQFFQTLVTLELDRSRPKIDKPTSTRRRKKKRVNVGLKSSTQSNCRRQEPKMGIASSRPTKTKKLQVAAPNQRTEKNGSFSTRVQSSNSRRNATKCSTLLSANAKSIRTNEECEIPSSNHQ